MRLDPNERNESYHNYEEYRTYDDVRKKSARNPWKALCIILAVVLLLILGLACFLLGRMSSGEELLPMSDAALGCVLGHEFLPATCTDPQICSACGATEGTAVGHDFGEANCTSAKACQVCGQREGAPLGHEWIPATYTSPEQCTRCGITRGNVKGFYPELPGDWKSSQVSVAGTNTYPWVFDDKVVNCVEFTMHFQITDINYGKVFGKFSLYCKNSKGKWDRLGTFDVSDQSEVVKTFTFDDPITFTQLAVVAPYRSSFSFSSRLWFEDWYLQD